MAPSSSPVRVVRLRHGVAIVPRGDGYLQVGSDPAHRVLLPDTPSVARTLAQLRYGVTSGDPGLLRALTSAGLLIDMAEERLLSQARGATRVALDSAEPWHSLATQLLEVAGLTAVTETADRDITWILSTGEPAREAHDPLLREDDPILFLAVFETRIRVGPFVLPGATACLRCIDAQTEPWHLRSTDNAQLGPVSHDFSPLLLHRALAAAVSDLCAWAEGRQPMTWSRSDWYDDRNCTTQQWQRHPHCGCSWSDTLTG